MMVDRPSSAMALFSIGQRKGETMLKAAFSSHRADPIDRPASGKHRRLRRVILGIVLAIFAGLALTVGLAASWLLEPNRYASVRTIETASTYRDPALMRAAWRLPVAARYARAAYEYQENQSFCGPASIANLLHSVGMSRSQDAVIEGTRYQPWFGVLLGGLTLDQEADLLRERTGQSVSIERGLSLAQFRRVLAGINEPGRRVIVNFHRGPLFGRGHGHFSPLLGYLVDRDLVLVGDVNPNYRPFLVSSERLWQAVDTIDPATGLKRGLLTVVVR